MGNGASCPVLCWHQIEPAILCDSTQQKKLDSWILQKLPYSMVFPPPSCAPSSALHPTPDLQEINTDRVIQRNYCSSSKELRCHQCYLCTNSAHSCFMHHFMNHVAMQLTCSCQECCRIGAEMSPKCHHGKATRKQQLQHHYSDGNRRIDESKQVHCTPLQHLVVAYSCTMILQLILGPEITTCVPLEGKRRVANG